MKAFIFFILSSSILFSSTAVVLAQQSVKSNPVVTEVGDAPDDQKPIFDPSPGGPGDVTGSPTICNGAPISLGYTKKFLPLPDAGSCSSTQTGACGRPGTCVTPNKIVLHTTTGSDNFTAEYIFQYFASGSGNRGVGAHFVIDQAGKVLQMVETLADRIEVAYAVANYSDHISIELVDEDIFSSKSESPSAQYQATLNLVRILMQQYYIPKGNLDSTWTAPSDSRTTTANPGVYGHYQLNPLTKGDPGIEFFRQFREDL